MMINDDPFQCFLKFSGRQRLTQKPMKIPARVSFALMHGDFGPGSVPKKFMGRPMAGRIKRSVGACPKQRGRRAVQRSRS